MSRARRAASAPSASQVLRAASTPPAHLFACCRWLPDCTSPAAPRRLPALPPVPENPDAFAAPPGRPAARATPDPCPLHARAALSLPMCDPSVCDPCPALERMRPPAPWRPPPAVTVYMSPLPSSPPKPYLPSPVALPPGLCCPRRRPAAALPHTVAARPLTRRAPLCAAPPPAYNDSLSAPSVAAPCRTLPPSPCKRQDRGANLALARPPPPSRPAPCPPPVCLACCCPGTHFPMQPVCGAWRPLLSSGARRRRRVPASRREAQHPSPPLHSLRL